MKRIQGGSVTQETGTMRGYDPYFDTPLVGEHWRSVAHILALHVGSGAVTAELHIRQSAERMGGHDPQSAAAYLDAADLLASAQDGMHNADALRELRGKQARTVAVPDPEAAKAAGEAA